MRRAPLAEGMPLRSRAVMSAISQPGKEELKLMWRSLRSPEEQVSVRMNALRRLVVSREIKDPDEAYLSLLQSDPSLEFRLRLANALKDGNEYRSGDGAIQAAIEEVHRQAAEAPAPSSRTPESEH